jgi:hypothetical protein
MYLLNRKGKIIKAGRAKEGNNKESTHTLKQSVEQDNLYHLGNNKHSIKATTLRRA